MRAKALIPKGGLRMRLRIFPRKMGPALLLGLVYSDGMFRILFFRFLTEPGTTEKSECETTVPMLY